MLASWLKVRQLLCIHTVKTQRCIDNNIIMGLAKLAILDLFDLWTIFIIDDMASSGACTSGT